LAASALLAGEPSPGRLIAVAGFAALTAAAVLSPGARLLTDLEVGLVAIAVVAVVATVPAVQWRTSRARLNGATPAPIAQG
jgi:hypothetical protein